MARGTHLEDRAPKEPTAPASRGAQSSGAEREVGLRISDAASRVGVSPRTLRYYEELGILTPSGYTAGGERRYQEADLAVLERIIELKDIVGMNLEEIKVFLRSEARLEELRAAYRARKDVPTKTARAQQREILQEILDLREALLEQLNTKLARLDAFRAELAAKAERVRQLLVELD